MEVFNVQVFATKEDYQNPNAKPSLERNFTNEEDADEWISNISERDINNVEFAYYGK